MIIHLPYDMPLDEAQEAVHLARWQIYPPDGKFLISAPATVSRLWVSATGWYYLCFATGRAILPQNPWGIENTIHVLPTEHDVMVEAVKRRLAGRTACIVEPR